MGKNVKGEERGGVAESLRDNGSNLPVDLILNEEKGKGNEEEGGGGCWEAAKGHRGRTQARESFSYSSLEKERVRLRVDRVVTSGTVERESKCLCLH